jgi:hypothetical protein
MSDYHRNLEEHKHSYNKENKNREVEAAKGETESHHRVNEGVAKSLSQRHRHEKEMNQIQEALHSEESLHKMAMHARHVMEASR